MAIGILVQTLATNAAAARYFMAALDAVGTASYNNLPARLRKG